MSKKLSYPVAVNCHHHVGENKCDDVLSTCTLGEVTLKPCSVKGDARMCHSFWLGNSADSLRFRPVAVAMRDAFVL